MYNFKKAVCFAASLFELPSIRTNKQKKNKCNNNNQISICFLVVHFCAHHMLTDVSIICLKASVKKRGDVISRLKVIRLLWFDQGS